MCPLVVDVLQDEGVSGICGRDIHHVRLDSKDLTYRLRSVLIEVVRTIMLAVRHLHGFLHTTAGDDPIYCNNNIDCHMQVM